MKKLLTSLVAVKKITSSVPRDRFSGEDIEQAAQLSLEAGGLINPIILRRISLQSYEVVDGHFEYYVAARAREIDPRQGEMIGAFILEPENEEILMQQVKTLRQRETGEASVNLRATSASSDVKVPTQQPDYFEADISRELSTLNEQTQELKTLIHNLEKLVDKKIAFLNHKLEKIAGTHDVLEKVEEVLNTQLEVFRQELNKTPTNRGSENAKTRYTRMTLEQLKIMAKKRKLPRYSRLKKSQLIAALENADRMESQR